jgi:predicted RNA-binding protein YlxR (DUF448 family)
MKTNILQNKKETRTCLACRGKFNKNQLIRIVKTPNGDYLVDKTGKLDGRGAYICHSADCAKKLFKNRLLNRTFKTAIPDEVYKAVEESLIDKQK